MHFHYETLEYEFLKKFMANPIQGKEMPAFFAGFERKILNKYTEGQDHNNVLFLMGNDFAYVSKA